MSRTSAWPAFALWEVNRPPRYGKALQAGVPALLDRKDFAVSFCTSPPQR